MQAGSSRAGGRAGLRGPCGGGLQQAWPGRRQRARGGGVGGGASHRQPLTARRGCCARSRPVWGPSWRGRTAGRGSGTRQYISTINGCIVGGSRLSPAPRQAWPRDTAGARSPSCSCPAAAPHLRRHKVWVLALVHQRLYQPQRHLLHAAGGGRGRAGGRGHGSGGEANVHLCECAGCKHKKAKQQRQVPGSTGQYRHQHPPAHQLHG